VTSTGDNVLFRNASTSSLAVSAQRSWLIAAIVFDKLERDAPARHAARKAAT
jgi:hypothetical protein